MICITAQDVVCYLYQKEGASMKIVICDDNLEDLSSIEELLKQYMKKREITDCSVEKYSDPSSLFEKIKGGEQADVYLLDMIMSEKTGIDIGTQLRDRGCENAIIYITSSLDYALDAYHVHAMRYLLKPLKRNDLFEALDHALAHMNVKSDPMYLVKTKDGLIHVPHSHIEYIENVSRMLDIHLINGERITSIFIRSSFDEKIEPLLESKAFLQVHKSFVVNLNCIKRLGTNHVIMDSGDKLPVSKAKNAAVKKEYLLFFSNQYR